MTYHAMFSLYIMTGLLALVISVSLFCKSIAEAKEWKMKFGERNWDYLYRVLISWENEKRLFALKLENSSIAWRMQPTLSGMHMVSAERNSTTGRKVEKDE